MADNKPALLKWESQGGGVESAIDAGVLYLRINVADRVKQGAVVDSKSGKTRVIASTHGFRGLGGGMSLSLNLTMPPIEGKATEPLL